MRTKKAAAFLAAVLSIAALYIVALVIVSAVEEHRQKEFTDLVKSYRPAIDGGEEDEETVAAASYQLSIHPRWDEVRRLNPDVAGSVSIPGTNVDYVVVQARDNEFYLSRDIRQSSSRAGSIFMDCRNALDSPDKNTLLYGRDTRNGAMFSDLTRYADSGFAAGHKVVRFSTLYADYEFYVFAAFYLNANNRPENVFYPSRIDFDSNTAFDAFINEAVHRSLAHTGIVVLVGDKLLTLMTVDEKYDPGQFVVLARMKREGE